MQYYFRWHVYFGQMTIFFVYNVLLLWKVVAMQQAIKLSLDGIVASHCGQSSVNVITVTSRFQNTLNHRCQHQRTKKRDRADEEAEKRDLVFFQNQGAQLVLYYII